MSEIRKVHHYHTKTPNNNPLATNMVDGEIAINMAADSEKLYIKNTNDEVVEFLPADKMQEKLVSGENVKTINGDSLLGEGNVEIPDASRRIFIGTQSEYEEAKANNRIDVGALVIILEPGEDGDSAISLLGTAILGKLVLGRS